MILRFIHSLIFFQILLGLFYLGFGFEQSRYLGHYDPLTLSPFILAVVTFFVYHRFQSLSLRDRTFAIFFQNALILGILTWLFSRTWGDSWEKTIVVYLTCSIMLLLFSSIFDKQFTKFVPADIGIPQNIWSLGSLLTAVNASFTSLLVIISSDNHSTLWIFYGLFWFFLWKTEL